MTDVDMKAMVAKAINSPVEFKSFCTKFEDLYMRDRAAFVIPALWSKFSANLIYALLVRRISNLNFRCPLCDACGDGATGHFRHEDDCVATDVLIRGTKEVRKKMKDLGYRLYDPDPASPILENRLLHCIDQAGNHVGDYILARR